MNKKITIGILAHVDAGKTTLADAFLNVSGKVKRPASVDEGTSICDFDEEEKDDEEDDGKKKSEKKSEKESEKEEKKEVSSIKEEFEDDQDGPKKKSVLRESMMRLYK